MLKPVLKEVRIRHGIWEGLLIQSPDLPAPTIEVTHLDQKLEGVSVVSLSSTPGHYAVMVPIPARMLRDGAHTFVIRAADHPEALGHISILIGIGGLDDLRAEVDLLRTELDILKRAFRRHVQSS